MSRRRPRPRHRKPRPRTGTRTQARAPPRAGTAPAPAPPRIRTRTPIPTPTVPVQVGRPVCPMAPAPARVSPTAIVPTARLPAANVAARRSKGRSFAPLANCARASKPAIPPIPRAAPRGSHAFQPAPRNASAVRSRSVRPPNRAPARGRAPGARRAGVVREAIAALIRRWQNPIRQDAGGSPRLVSDLVDGAGDWSRTVLGLRG
jgi:hypothetical protein